MLTVTFNLCPISVWGLKCCCFQNCFFLVVFARNIWIKRDFLFIWARTLFRLVSTISFQSARFEGRYLMLLFGYPRIPVTIIYQFISPQWEWDGRRKFYAPPRAVSYADSIQSWIWIWSFLIGRRNFLCSMTCTCKWIIYFKWLNIDI